MVKNNPRKKSFLKKAFRDIFLFVISVGILMFAFLLLWISNIQLPDFNNFENRDISNSTKIYDRTGQVVLYNINDNLRRTEVSIDKISPYIKEATVSIEDEHFYEHSGFRPTSFIRALIANFQNIGFSQGGSTIDMQVIKNALLSREKTITRKLKEIILAMKLDKELSKDKILQIYLNESPYGGTIYGVEEASLTYFNKHASDVDIAEAAYLAALPQSPTYYSPYGKHTDALEIRKNLVIQKMFELGYITEQEKVAAQNEKINFEHDMSDSGKALHFVMYIREYLAEKYSEDEVLNGGLKVITTLDYDLQSKLEEVVKQGALDAEKRFGATNEALVAIDPHNGQILSMVGSRDFFDTEIPGQFNVALANRQPGSSIKPIFYAEAFREGYTPETVLFDVPTQFSTLCDAEVNPISTEADKNNCYMPENYDGLFRGPISLRNALAQSLNVPAVKLLYLIGIKNAIAMAQSFGLSTITSAGDYGLTLVLGGGEVSLLELTNAYGVFANNGKYNAPVGILDVRDKDGALLEKFNQNEKEVLSDNITSLISSVLSDKTAKIPAYGQNSPLYFGDRPVASKTGTTNDYRDVWVLGYTPSIVIGMWGGNNNNTPIDKKTSGLVLAPTWRKSMDVALNNKPIEYFPEPLPNSSQKPILKGLWCSPYGVHSILQSVIKNNPDGPYPTNPADDPQYNSWEYAVQKWISKNGDKCTSQSTILNTTVFATSTVSTTTTN